jgi:hypothetical protein
VGEFEFVCANAVEAVPAAANMAARKSLEMLVTVLLLVVN